MSLSSKGLEFDVEAFDNAPGCEGTECLTLFEQLKENYDDTIRKIDVELGSDGTEVKMGVT
jgi:hypothetical protein